MSNKNLKNFINDITNIQKGSENFNINKFSNFFNALKEFTDSQTMKKIYNQNDQNDQKKKILRTVGALFADPNEYLLINKKIVKTSRNFYKRELNKDVYEFIFDCIDQFHYFDNMLTDIEYGQSDAHDIENKDSLIKEIKIILNIDELANDIFPNILKTRRTNSQNKQSDIINLLSLLIGSVSPENLNKNKIKKQDKKTHTAFSTLLIKQIEFALKILEPETYPNLRGNHKNFNLNTNLDTNKKPSTQIKIAVNKLFKHSYGGNLSPPSSTTVNT